MARKDRERMNRAVFVSALFLLMSCAVTLAQTAPREGAASGLADARLAVGATLDAFHAAAARADEAAYFDLFAPEAVFLGTDATERWDREQFRAFAHPYFAKGTAWTFVPRDRHVELAIGGTVAWFDELLDSASYGECRGSGVLEKIDGRWRVRQYNLTIPVPNDLAKELVGRIRETAAAKKPTQK